MKEQLNNWIDKLLSDSDLTREEFLWGTMIVALLCASTHLLTMLITRWGDSRATSKSWVFSALLHVGCVVGLIVFSPPVDHSTRVDARSEPIQIQGLIFEEPPLDSKPSELWERVKPTELNEVVRSEQPERNPLERPEPDRTHEENVLKLEELVERLQTEPEAADPTVPEGVDSGRVEELAEAFLPDELIPELLPQEEINQPSNETRTREETLNRTDTPAAAIERLSSSQPATEQQPVVLSRELNTLDVIENPQALLRDTSVNEVRSRSDRPDLVEPEGPASDNSVAVTDTEGPVEFSRTRRGDEGAAAAMSLDRQNPNAVNRTLGKEGSLLARTPNTLSDSAIPQPQLQSPAPVELKAIAPQPKNYQLRNLAKRREIAQKNGGTEESEQAVERSLAWLAKVQNPQGYWDADRYGAGQVGVDEAGVDRQYAGKQSDTGLTSLAVLAFLGAGYTHEEGQYEKNVEKALRWLVSQQREDGYLGGNARAFEMMYCHGMATYALAEAYGMRQELDAKSWLREPIEKGAQYVISQQNPKDGGWRYLLGQPGDMSLFGWQLMALKSAEISGIAIPQDVKVRMVRFLKDRSLGENQGLAGYVKGQPPADSMTAEALFCKQMLGINRTNPACIEAVDHMLMNLPSRNNYNLYYWYYGTLAMYQHGGQSWETWNGSLRDRIVSEQRRTGDFAGSWEPRSVWSPYGGRIYSTTLSTLCLEVYYRFLPLYRMQEELDEPAARPGE
ncbi:Prenyltransferase and squalene oxidase repeat protein [Polystyrenella longa]|uniref:Prenyltransferase and squalene oxidase repeat protein n=1 Tax=Polystyrenella longa TaxID=2528007 RepID=A0A518CHZ8_9PLAN|nr:prenyltransferase/squalene oxidase repeat-containing protein [Polystyrenella longa]QDU78846.1 Prenyltransferase and squalene oxidase repeat protein [Polystyrenella longa]